MAYVPEGGDIVWLQFNPQAGHEQRGRRPALVLSPETYNKKVGLMICCPITSKVKGYPYEVQLPDNLDMHRLVFPPRIYSKSYANIVTSDAQS